MRRPTRNLVVFLVLVGLFSYLLLPGLIEDQISGRLQTAFGTPTEPDVEVSSKFPPMMLLGRIDRVRVTMDQASVQGVTLYDVNTDLEGVKIDVPELIGGNLAVETSGCSFSAESPPVLIDDNATCLDYLGLGQTY